MSDFTIGVLSKETGCKVQTVRYYEQVGLMPEPHRSEGNQRLYDRNHVVRLRFIRHARDLGFTIEEIRELLDLSDTPDQPCADIDAIASRHLSKVDEKIAQLSLLQTELSRMVDQCQGGTVETCRVVEILSDHGECLSETHK